MGSRCRRCVVLTPSWRLTGPALRKIIKHPTNEIPQNQQTYIKATDQSDRSCQTCQSVRSKRQIKATDQSDIIMSNSSLPLRKMVLWNVIEVVQCTAERDR